MESYQNTNPDEAAANLAFATNLSEQLMMSQGETEEGMEGGMENEEMEAPQGEMMPEKEMPEMDHGKMMADMKPEMEKMMGDMKEEMKKMIQEEVAGIKESLKSALEDEQGESPKTT